MRIWNNDTVGPLDHAKTQMKGHDGVATCGGFAKEISMCGVWNTKVMVWRHTIANTYGVPNASIVRTPT